MKKWLLLMVGLLSAVSLSARAGLIGDTVHFEISSTSGDYLSTSFLVGPGEDAVILGDIHLNLGAFPLGDIFMMRADSDRHGFFDSVSTEMLSMTLSDMDFPAGAVLFEVHALSVFSDLEIVDFGTDLSGKSFVTWTLSEGQFIPGGSFPSLFKSMKVPEGSSMIFLVFGLVGLYLSRRWNMSPLSTNAYLA